MKQSFKIKKVLFYSIITLILCLSFNVWAAHKRSTSSIVIDAISGEIIASSNANELRYPASLTKLMTLYLTFEAIEKGHINLETPLKVSHHAANRSPSKLGLKRGETITVKNAILALIVKSANDCASVLAEALGDSEENFAKMMTETAKKLGMKNTTFKNASGLPNKQQKTTAHDMAILGSAIYHHYPEHYDLFSTKKFTYKGNTFYTHNHLLKKFKGADGMKTGFTSAAGYNIITSAEQDGRRVIAVTMGHNSIKERDYKVAQLMKHGLKKINNQTLNPTKLTAKLDIPPFVDKKIPDNNIWSIQIGAFSNYIKARNYALEVQNRIHLPYAAKTEINVEPASNGAAVIYRSQLTGFAKNEADKICYRLKKVNRSCIVVASQNEQQLVMADK